MSFNHVLNRLREAATTRQQGMRQGQAMVRTDDLREFVEDWSRMDSKLRILHDSPSYPIHHGQNIIQYHDETFVWYDEAGLQGGVTYSLEQTQRELQRYGESLNAPKLDPAAFAPIQQPGYDVGEIPHQFGDLTDFAAKLLKQNEAMRDVMARMQICLAKARKAMEGGVTISSALAQRLQERLDPHRDAKDWGELVAAQLGTAKIVCKDCGWPHINTTESCDDATARERGKS